MKINPEAHCCSTEKVHYYFPATVDEKTKHFRIHTKCIITYSLNVLKQYCEDNKCLCKYRVNSPFKKYITTNFPVVFNLFPCKLIESTVFRFQTFDKTSTTIDIKK